MAEEMSDRSGSQPRDSAQDGARGGAAPKAAGSSIPRAAGAPESTGSPGSRPAAAPWPLGPLGLELRRAGATVPPPAGEAPAPRVAVLGLARSGVAAARLLLDRGCRVELLDLVMPVDEEASIRDLEQRGARLRIGPHDPAWLPEFDLLVKSPGVPAGAPFLIEARARGVPVIGELELAFLAAAGLILAITGTNGKSTTTAWAGDMFREAGVPVQVVGNIGRAMSDGVLEDPDAVFVVEVSSFQLEDARTFRPRVACLLNLTPDHLDRHGSLEAYREAKFKIFDRQEEEDLALIGPDEDLAKLAAPRLHARRARFAPADLGADGSFVRDEHLWLRLRGRETRLLPERSLSLPGPHNLENALAAAAGAAELGAEPDAIARSLSTFAGLPHRLEPVGTLDGVRFVNDSKATNTDSLAVALRSFPEPVILIAGGLGKGQDFRPLAPLVRARVGLLILIGRDAEAIGQAWNDVPSIRAGSLEEAVSLGRRNARAGGVVLLSPACASFDMFRNYEDRGDRFRSLVRALQGRS